MKALSRGISFVTVALLLIAGPASATLVAIGDPVEGDSWSHRFLEDGIGLFDNMVLQMYTAGDSFRHAPEGAGISGFSPSTQGWHQTSDNGTVLAAAGNALNSLGFDVTFEGWFPSWNPLSFYLSGYTGGMLLQTSDARWDGCKWTIVDGPVVPEPVSMVMLGCLGAGMFAARKLRGKRAT